MNCSLVTRNFPQSGIRVTSTLRMREEFNGETDVDGGYCIDRPDTFPAGSHVRFTSLDGEELAVAKYTYEVTQ